MWLALDVRNTPTAVGLFSSEDALRRTWRRSTHPIRTPDEFRVYLGALLREEGLALSEIQAATISSVVPSTTSMLRSAFQHLNERGELRVVDSSFPFSFAI